MRISPKKVCKLPSIRELLKLKVFNKNNHFGGCIWKIFCNREIFIDKRLQGSHYMIDFPI